MKAKLGRIEEVITSGLHETAQLMHDKWDNELGQFMRSAEKFCTKFKGCAIEYSPTVGQWLRCRSVLQWLLRWHDGKVPDAWNLRRAARRVNITDPLSLSKPEVHAGLQGCLDHLFELRSKVLALRKKHLQWQLLVAKDCGDDVAAQKILHIVRNQARRQRQ